MTLTDAVKGLQEVGMYADQCEHARAHMAEKQLWQAVLQDIAADETATAPSRELARTALLSQEIDFRRTFG